MTTERTGRLPIHLGVYWHGVAERIPGGARMRSACGPYVELLAESVDRLTLVAHDPPTDSPHAEGMADYTARPSRDNIEILSLGPLGGRRDYLARMRRVKRILGPASEDWDVLLLRFGRRANLAFRANRCPRVVTLVWGTATAGGRLGDLARSGEVAQLVAALRSEFHLRRVLRGSSLAFTDGEECLDRCKGDVPEERMGLLRSSSRRAEYAHVAEDRLTGEDPRFLVVGHVTESKGIFDAIEAFRRIRADLFGGARLHVAGVGPALEEARRRVEAAGLADAVTFHGWVPAGGELFGLYRDADVLLFPSRSSTESLPRVVSEAWAHSVLVVATPVGSLPLAYEDGTELLFVPPGDVDAVVDAVKTLSADPGLRSRLLAAGRDRAREATLEHVADRLITAVGGRWPDLVRPRKVRRS